MAMFDGDQGAIKTTPCTFHLRADVTNRSKSGGLESDEILETNSVGVGIGAGRGNDSSRSHVGGACEFHNGERRSGADPDSEPVATRTGETPQIQPQQAWPPPPHPPANPPALLSRLLVRLSVVAARRPALLQPLRLLGPPVQPALGPRRRLSRLHASPWLPPLISEGLPQQSEGQTGIPAWPFLMTGMPSIAGAGGSRRRSVIVMPGLVGVG